ncbi:AAA family ATPase [Wolbachia endosymbiont (group A) of Tiphia femorata]|uniref:AAA family ATPase n=1 Tax=Wolbachia endosymbiont (group A) of Tiphia femorata TaxID=2954063 RepID=UPI00222E4BA9|nr:AAA family ATPase [Wolbachia endosymbiont (group A) of Tiphia femorata]
MDFWSITENFLWKDSEDVLGIRSLLLHNIKACISHFFPNGRFYKKKFCVADLQKDQIIVDMKAGNWSSLVTGKSGDIISLWALVTGKNKLHEVIGLISKWLNAERFIYFDENGKDIIYVYFYNANRYYAWSSKTCTKPLFNIPKIIKSNRVVVVKGEKCAEKLTNQGITATTVMFGIDDSIDETDFSPLNGKHIIIWPDNNKAGKQYAEKIANKLSNLKCSILNIPEDKKGGWNAIDAIAEKIDINQLLISNNAVVKENVSAFSVKQYLGDKSPIPKDIISPRILTPGGLLVFGGTPNVGKTDFLISWLANMSAGVPFFDMVPAKPLKIFYLQTDVGYHYMRERLQQLKIDNKLLNLVENNFAITSDANLLLDENNISKVYNTVKQFFNPAEVDVIVIDSLRNVFNYRNENDNDVMYAFLQEKVERLRSAINPNAGVILTHNVNKKLPKENPFQSLSGASSLRNVYTSGILMLKPIEEENIRQLMFESKNGQSLPTKFISKIDGSTGWSNKCYFRSRYS